MSLGAKFTRPLPLIENHCFREWNGGKTKGFGVSSRALGRFEASRNILRRSLKPGDNLAWGNDRNRVGRIVERYAQQLQLLFWVFPIRRVLEWGNCKCIEGLGRHIKKEMLADGKKIATGKLMPYLKKIVGYLQPTTTMGNAGSLLSDSWFCKKTGKFRFSSRPPISFQLLLQSSSCPLQKCTQKSCLHFLTSPFMPRPSPVWSVSHYLIEGCFWLRSPVTYFVTKSSAHILVSCLTFSAAFGIGSTAFLK